MKCLCRVGVECLRYFQDESIFGCVEEPRDCVGLGVGDTKILCRAQPWLVVTPICDIMTRMSCIVGKIGLGKWDRNCDIDIKMKRKIMGH